MLSTTKICFLIVWVMSFAQQISAQPAVAKPIPTPNGEVWLVDESWFEKEPPFLEFYRFGETDGLTAKGDIKVKIQDSRGDIWMTDNSDKRLIRYDGHTFKIFSDDEADSLHFISSHILQVLETSEIGRAHV